MTSLAVEVLVYLKESMIHKPTLNPLLKKYIRILSMSVVAIIIILLFEITSFLRTITRFNNAPTFQNDMMPLASHFVKAKKYIIFQISKLCERILVNMIHRTNAVRQGY